MAMFSEKLGIAIVIFALLAAATSAEFQSTCPGHVEHCSEQNKCTTCHPSCKFCQNIGKDFCAAQDCIQCHDGYSLIEQFDDGTGSCVADDRAYRETCPRNLKGCKPGNRCEKCPENCQYCQGNRKLCSSDDCLVCQPGYMLQDLFDDGTGRCVAIPDTDNHRKGLAAAAASLFPRKYHSTCPEHVAGCSPYNRCKTCHESCATCQNTVFDTCSADDCMTCPEGYVLTAPLFSEADGVRKGYCEPIDNGSSLHVYLGAVLVLTAVAFAVIMYRGRGNYQLNTNAADRLVKQMTRASSASMLAGTGSNGKLID